MKVQRNKREREKLEREREREKLKEKTVKKKVSFQHSMVMLSVGREIAIITAGIEKNRTHFSQ